MLPTLLSKELDHLIHLKSILLCTLNRVMCCGRVSWLNKYARPCFGTPVA